MKKRGAQIFFESLLKEKVDTIFGYPGGAVLDIYHELPNYPLRHILVRHEQGAVHAADGYARASGKIGIALVTSGPGATNTVTGVATAYMDSIPVIIFTGQVPTRLIGNDAFQEADIVGITRPCTKHNYLVKDVRDMARVIKEAFYLAKTGRPGPIIVDLPKDVLQAECNFHYPEEYRMRSYNPTYKGHLGQIKKALKEIHNSKKPLIYYGGGVISSEASEELTRFARRLGIPVTATLMGLGGFPGNDPLFLGMLGMHGTYFANMATSHCDLLIAIGARFDDRVTGKIDEFASEAKIIHIDIDPTSISKNVRVDIPIVGDAREVLNTINLMLDNEKVNPQAFKNWLSQVHAWKKEVPLTYTFSKEVIKPQYVVEKLYGMTMGDAIITTEVGQNQMWAAQFYTFTKPRTFLTSGGLGTMGYGLPAAIGAQAAFPDKIVIDIAGDGSIQMNIQELTTAKQFHLPVKVAILNNGYLGMVRQWQQIFYDGRYSSTSLDVSPDFVKLAEAYGVLGLRAERPDEVEKVIEEALSSPLPCLMDFRVEREEGVFPMVPTGSPINKMLLV